MNIWYGKLLFDILQGRFVEVQDSRGNPLRLPDSGQRKGQEPNGAL